MPPVPKKPAEDATPLDKLRAKFPAGVVKQRELKGKKLDYVAIDATINRLLDVYGTEYEFTGAGYEVRPAMITRRSGDGYKEVPGWTGIVTGYLVTPTGKQHWGIGADSDEDLDKVLKTALAEAIKKAGHQLGIGLYLWNEEDRVELAQQRKLVAGNPSALKAELVKRSGLKLGKDKAENVRLLSEHYHVTPEQLEDVEVMKQLLGVV